MGNCCSSDSAKTKYTAVGSLPRLNPEFSVGHEAAAAAALVAGAASYTSWVELRFSCTSLQKKDVLSKSDPMLVLFEVDNAGREKELGRTEMIADNHDPTFITGIRSLYNFEKLQPLRALVVDIDSGQSAETCNPRLCDFLGELDFKLSEVVAARGKTVIKPLVTRSAHKSQITIRAEEISSAREILTFTLAASGLRNVELLSKSDPFLEISKQQGDGVTWLPVFKTEVRDNNLNPTWAPIKVKAQALNNGDQHRPIMLKVHDWEANGKHRLLGQVQTTSYKLAELAGSPGAVLQLQLPGKPAGIGSLGVSRFQVEVQPTFLDYVRGGVELSFMVAVDFTGSNGDPRDPQSLHYSAGPYSNTPYEEALTGVGKVLEFYDSNRQFPAFGFGGQRPGQAVSHCFPLNGSDNAACAGIDGIKAAYRQALTQYALSGPTLFAPMIQTATSLASQPSPHLTYQVLLILTDGAIMDMEDTIKAIITASSYPMSILIVGIGNADFSSMEKLDSDDKLLSFEGRTAERDIVQFVEFSKFRNNGDALAAELLAELPGQFLAYVRQRNIPPPPPPAMPAPPPMM